MRTEQAYAWLKTLWHSLPCERLTELRIALDADNGAFLAPFLDAAIALATLELLTALESPLVQSGKAQELLRQQGRFQGSFVSTARFRVSAAWFLWPLLGIALIVAGTIFLAAADAHFTAA